MTLVIQTSMVILTKQAGISPVTLRRMTFLAYLLKVSSLTSVEVPQIEKVTKRMLRHVLGDHIYSQFRF